MKPVLLVLIWCAAVFLSLLTLYRVVPPETQYAMAEHFEIYGDELIMDFVLYVLFGMALFIASVITSAIYLLMLKK